MTRWAALTLALAICSGCTPKTVYNWGNYENSLYGYYQSPKSAEDHELYMSQLLVLIEQTQRIGSAVPPGLYAEYGYGLFRTGSHQEAIQYFEKEKTEWSESAPLMDRMIANVRRLVEEKENGSP